MAAAVGLRGDYGGLRGYGLAKRSDDADQTRRLLAVAAIYNGGPRSEAAKIGGVGLQAVRDWCSPWEPTRSGLSAAPWVLPSRSSLPNNFSCRDASFSSASPRQDKSSRQTGHLTP